MKTIAKIHTDYKEKFGIPRQSGLDGGAIGKIVFEKDYRSPEALRGLEDFSHLWLIWEFSESKRETWSPTVRPPRLGGNKRMGVFATRSPYRPNPIGLSSVKIESIKTEAGLGTVIYVRGADLLDGTPIYDIKPYVAYTDSHPDARSGFADENFGKKLAVELSDEAKRQLSDNEQHELVLLLEEDPRPSYQNDPERKYGMKFSNFEVFFKVNGTVLTVTEIKRFSL